MLLNSSKTNMSPYRDRFDMAEKIKIRNLSKQNQSSLLVGLTRGDGSAGQQPIY